MQDHMTYSILSHDLSPTHLSIIAPDDHVTRVSAAQIELLGGVKVRSGCVVHAPLVVPVSPTDVDELSVEGDSNHCGSVVGR